MKRHKLFKISLSLSMILGLFLALGTNTSAATDPRTAPVDWAFKESSIPLHDAILTKYPTIDTNSDGYISIAEASVKAGGVLLSGQSITGTLDGIEYFTNITDLRLNQNQLSGSIPTGLSNISSLQYLYLNANQLTGEIPSSLGTIASLKYIYLNSNQLSGQIPESLGSITGLGRLIVSDNLLTGPIPASLGNIGSLIYLYLHNNQLTGEIPSSLGSLQSLQFLSLYSNNLTGQIPTSLGNLNSLESLLLSDNQLTGEIPLELGAINTLKILNIYWNNGLTGNLSTIFNNHPSLELLIVNRTSTIQQKPQIPTLQVYICDLMNPTNDDVLSGLTQVDIDEQKQQIENWITRNNIVIGSDSDSDKTITILREEIALAESLLRVNPIVDSLFTIDGTSLAEGVTQDTINNAQSEINTLPEGPAKDRLQAEIDKAQDMLNAKDAVNNLFNDKKDNLADGVTQGTINNAQDLVNKLPDGDLKTELQKEIDKAQDMLNAKDTVGSLLDDDGKLNVGITQDDINNAQNLVNKLPNGELKNELQAIIDEAQRQLDAKNTSISKPTTTNPTGNGTSTTTISSVNTGDYSNTILLIGMMTASITVISFIKKKKAIK
ncbi:MAG: toxin Cry1Ac domain D-VI-related protein [Coprobacillaceae bacterium]